MNKKLTLSIEESIIKKAKLYAKKKGQSVSDIIENYLKTITSDQDTIMDISPTVKSLKGSFKAPENFDYKKELTEALSKKYLK